MPTLREIADHWGCKHTHVWREVKKGCPTNSLMAADQWRAANTKRGAGYRSRPTGVTPSPPPAPMPTPKPGVVPIVPPRPFVQRATLPSARPPLAGPVRPEAKALPSQTPAEPITRDLVTLGERAVRTGLESLEASLQGAIDIETEAHAMVLEAQKDASALGAARLPPLISSYGNANSARMAAEKAVRALQREEKILIPLDEAKNLVARVLGPLINRMRGLPKQASKANPNDMPFAEGIISVEVEVIIADVGNLYRGFIETGTVEDAEFSPQ